MRAVIVNPASASGRTESRWRRIVASLERDGERVEVLLTTGPGDGIDIARRVVGEGIRDLVVLGGDGTVGEVVAGCVRPDGTGMLAQDIELSVIHQGTGGDYARGLGLPKDEEGAIEVARSGRVRRVDVGVASFARVAGLDVAADEHDGALVRGFASCANVGLASEVVAKAVGRLKRLGNSGAFAVATVGCIVRNRPRPLTLRTVEGLDAQLDVVDVDICNNRFMGGGMLVAPDSEFDDGRFDVVVIGAAGRLKLLRTFPKIYKGTHVRDPLVRVERTRSIEIGSPGDGPREGVVLDGEYVGSTPATFRVLERAIGVRVPV